VIEDADAISVFLERSECEDFIKRAFAESPELKGKTWQRSKRPALTPAPAKP